MELLRKSTERGTFDFGWLKTAHSFSFGEYHDPRWMGFRSLRVLNEDRVAPGRGFPRHPHRDAEILSLVLTGTLAHQDSMGNKGTIAANELQYMSAGSGITHSEYNASESDPVHFIQIWLVPNERAASPRYEHRALTDYHGPLKLIASGNPTDQVITIRQDAKIFLVEPRVHEPLPYSGTVHRHFWIQILEGTLRVGSNTLYAGDGIGISGEHSVVLEAPESGTKALLFDLQ